VTNTHITPADDRLADLRPDLTTGALKGEPDVSGGGGGGGEAKPDDEEAQVSKRSEPGS